jgi:hypothetical protein
VLGLILYITSSFSILESLLVLYSNLVRSEFEYASVVWNSITSTDSSKLERIKRKYAVLCYTIFVNGVCNYNYEDIFFFPVTLQSLKDLGRLTYRRFVELFKHMVGLLGRVISPSQGLCLHRTTQHRKTWTNIHALSGIRTHDPSNQPTKTHTSNRTATVTGEDILLISNLLTLQLRRRNLNARFLINVFFIGKICC